jgi:hypothetical protein
MLVFWVLMLYGLVGTSISEGHTDLKFSAEDGCNIMFCRNIGIYLQVHRASAHAVTTQKTNTDIFTTMRTSYRIVNFGNLKSKSHYCKLGAD